jgi:hypothetical protein
MVALAGVVYDPNEDGKDYCAYSQYAAMLARTDIDWLVSMYETYIDDSGTNAQSEIAIAACYVSTESGWRKFVKEWDIVRTEEGFDAFHMAEFVAPRNQGHRPWCDWDNSKKDRVYHRLAKIINDNKRTGFGSAVPKSIYDTVPQRIRDHYGNEHYTFAVRMCMLQIYLWREKSFNSLPMQYIFDWEKPGSPKHAEITKLMSTIHEKLKPMFGLDAGGFSFQHKEQFKPLQAADVLAWQMNAYIPKIYPEGESNFEKVHPGFRVLRENQDLTLGFYTASNMQGWLDIVLEFEAKHGIVP